MGNRCIVFVSSTFEDLKQERRDVIEALLGVDCAPVAMEYFPATSMRSWDYVQQRIDECDIFLLLIGCCYGTLTERGISFTEQEYRYAVEKQKPVLVFIQKYSDIDPQYAPAVESPTLPQLMAFRELCLKRTNCRFWERREQLARDVLSAIYSESRAASHSTDAGQLTSGGYGSGQSWNQISRFGVVTCVYVSPSGLADKYYVAQVLHALQSDAPIQEVLFFDDATATPSGVPMTDHQLLHWRARYSRNNRTHHEEFVFIQVKDAACSPPALLVNRAVIRPGYAE